MPFNVTFVSQFIVPPVTVIFPETNKLDTTGKGKTSKRPELIVRSPVIERVAGAWNVPKFPGFKLSPVKVNEGNVELTIPVSNKGKRAGTEIIQVYVHKTNDTDGPLKTLKGFKRIELAAGKSGQAIIDLPSASFEFFDRTTGKMAVAPGEYEIWYGNSSGVKDLKMATITIQP